MELSNEILSDITVYMKYARYLPELNRRETWEETGWRLMLYITFNSAMLKSKATIRSSPA